MTYYTYRYYTTLYWATLVYYLIHVRGAPAATPGGGVEGVQQRKEHQRYRAQPALLITVLLPVLLLLGESTPSYLESTPSNL
eukprot:3079237-Pyramimonas_sp.AAC.1